MDQTTQLSDPRARIEALDALRGFALCGIVLINIGQTFAMRDMPDAVGLLLFQRFFVIFSLLFGIGFGIFLDSAARRTDRPRVALVRRLLVLGGFGALHLLLQPGEVLSWYAAIGLLVLLPFSWAPRAATLAAGVVATGAASFFGGVTLVPGLFLLGLGLAAYGVPRSLPARTGLLAGLFGAFAVASVAIYAIVVGPGWPLPRAALPMVMSFAYITGFLLLLRTPVGGAVGDLFAPLGRMALTNYLAATVVFVPVGTALGLEGSTRWGRAGALAAGILLVQAVVSPLWLRVFRYGPLEWVWRCATWARWVPIRREERVAAMA